MNEQEGGKKTFREKLKETGTKAWDKSKELAAKAGEAINKEIEDHKLHQAWKHGFIDATHEYEIVGVTPGKVETIRAFRDIENLDLFILSDDKKLSMIISGSVLRNMTDKSNLRVSFVDDKNGLIKKFQFEDNNFEAQCIRLKCTLYEEKTPQNVTNIVNQSVSIDHSSIEGGVNQIADITNKLNDFETALMSYKPGWFHKNAYQETIKMYGSFKEAAINQKKDSSIVQQFLKLLSFAPHLVELAKALFK
jgi:hypothetical protein